MKAKTELTRDDMNRLDLFLQWNSYGYKTQRIVDSLKEDIIPHIESPKIQKELATAQKHLEKARHIFEKYEELLRQNERSLYADIDE